MILLAEILRVTAIVLLVISAGFYLTHLEKTKKQRKLKPSESIVYVTIQLAYVLFAIGLLIEVFFR